MKKVTLIIITVFLLLGCNKKNKENFYESKRLNDFKLSLIDSLIFYNEDKLFISQTYDIISNGRYILISDFNFMKVWIFNKNLKLIKIIGHKGHGPQEYTYPPNIVFVDDTLYLIDTKSRNINIYDKNFNFINGIKLPNDIVFPGYSPIYNKKNFIFFGFKPEEFSYDNLSNSPSLFAFDCSFNLKESFFTWDKEYDNKTAYLLDNLKVLLCNGGYKDFFAKQTGTFKITNFDENFNQYRSFGIKPKYYRNPPDAKFSEVQRSAEAAVEFTSQTTTFLRIEYDDINSLLLINYVNLEKDFFYERTLLLGKHYLQVYNKKYDCIYDGPIPGKLAFTMDGRIYILTDEKPEFIKFKVFKLIKQ